jgi:two-component system response regulator YesN
MWNLLIVDDENYMVEDIKASVDWARLGISNIFTAFNMRQAKEIFKTKVINIMLSDIEMPQGSGLELLTWVRENYPKTQSIFLTCHADFSYAKEAVRLGSFDYILKPIPYEELEASISKVINKISQDSKLEEYSRFGQFWFKHQPILIERFWMDIISESIPSNAEDIKSVADYRNIPYTDKMKVLTILIVVQRWHNKMSLQDEKSMEYGLKNIAEEMFLEKEQIGHVFTLKNNEILGIIPLGDGSDFNSNKIEEECKKYIIACKQYLNCDLSCYIGEPVYAYELAAKVYQLTKFKKSNEAFFNKVFYVNENTSKYEEQVEEMKLPVYKAIKYIKEHLEQELPREEIASFVFLNPDYFDRVFKKETGVSVARFIMQERLDKAKELLIKTELPISTIASTVGYTNLSNFSSMFKKMCGMNPVEYRKKNWKVKP